MAMAQTAKTDGKKTRGDGPVVVMYIDAQNKEHKRVPADVVQVKVTGKDGKAGKTYAIDSLPVGVRNQLAAFAFARRADIFIRNSVDDDGKVNVLDKADEVFNSLKEGKFYSRGEGKGGPGRTFDIDLWVETMKVAAAKKGTPATPKQLTTFKSKLEAMQGKDRSTFLMKLTKDPNVKLAKLEIEAKKLGGKKASTSDDYNALSDAF